MGSTIESRPVNIATVARFWDFSPGFLYDVYRNQLSDYHPDISSGKWKPAELITADEQTGEILSEKPLYIFKPENIGEMMNIDDKQIGGDGFTILSNTQTGKIAMMLESTRSEEVEGALELFGDDLHRVESISCDMSPTYLKACRTKLPAAQVVGG